MRLQNQSHAPQPPSSCKFDAASRMPLNIVIVYTAASVVVSSFQNFCTEAMLQHSFSECAS